MYYNGVNVINSNCPICFVLGSRSAGKSFYFKKYAIDRFLKNSEEFIYIRRYQTELDEVIQNILKMLEINTLIYHLIQMVVFFTV